MDRRAFIAGTGAVLLAAPLAAEAQQAPKIWRIGYLGLNSQPQVQNLLDALRLGLRERGLTEEREIIMEYRFAQGKAERLVDLAGELVQARVDVIVTSTDTLGLAVKRVTTTIPIVMVGGGRSGGERPGDSRVAILWYGDNPAKAPEVEAIKAAARSLRMGVYSVPVRGLEPPLSNAFAAMRRDRVQAALILGDAYTFGHREEMAARAVADRLPTMFEVKVSWTKKAP
jgi:putative ABC transport system substrate-binding protein